MIGLPTSVSSRMSVGSMPASRASLDASSLKAPRIASVIRTAPPGFIIA